MNRLCGLRPMEVRELAGWEWVFETWIQREAAAGSIAPGVVAARHAIVASGTDPKSRSSDIADPAQAVSI